MDRASDYGSEGWGFKSLRGRILFKKNLLDFLCYYININSFIYYFLSEI